MTRTNFNTNNLIFSNVRAKIEIDPSLRPPWMRDDDLVFLPIPQIYKDNGKGEAIASFIIEDARYRAIVRDGDDIIFNFDHKATIDNIVFERYFRPQRSPLSYLPFHYHRIPTPLRQMVAGWLTKRKIKNNRGRPDSFPKFPLDKSLEALKYIIRRCKLELQDEGSFWPDDKCYCVVLTHDIDTRRGFRWIKAIQQVEADYGFTSSWNIVGRLYRIDHSILEYLVEKGCEIGLHGYNHDNRIAYQGRKKIEERIGQCQKLIERYHIQGFRSPYYLRSPNLLNTLSRYFLYDSSIPDVDSFSLGTESGGCGSIFPYRFDKLIELPVTLPYEIPLLAGLDRRSLNSFWRKKIDWVREAGGMILVNTHPDPHYCGSKVMLKLYGELLSYLSGDNKAWYANPALLAKWYREKIFKE